MLFERRRKFTLAEKGIFEGLGSREDDFTLIFSQLYQITFQIYSDRATAPFKGGCCK